MAKLTLILAQATTAAPADTALFGNKWIALAVILAGVFAFIGLIAVIGRILAATHPDEKKAAATANSTAPAQPADIAIAANASTDHPSAQVLAAIAAAVAVVCGPKARIAGVQTSKPPSVEALMQMWSLEGRRQIYTSHNPRR